VPIDRGALPTKPVIAKIIVLGLGNTPATQ
jgi:hypothetical protein